MYESVLKWLKLSESIVATAAYAVVAILLMVDVIGRELFATSFLGMQQIAVYGAIVAGFLGLTLATSDNAHLRPEFLDFLAGRYEFGARRFGDALSAAFYFGATYVAFTFVLISMEAGDKAPVLYFLIWPLQLAIPYAFASAAVKHLIYAIRPGLKPFSGEVRG